MIGHGYRTAQTLITQLTNASTDVAVVLGNFAVAVSGYGGQLRHARLERETLPCDC